MISASRGCSANIAGTPGFRMPAFSAAIFRQRVTKKILVIEVDRRDHANRRVHHIGRVQTAAHPDFEHDGVHMRWANNQKRHCRDGFEVSGVQVEFAGLEHAFRQVVDFAESCGELSLS